MPASDPLLAPESGDFEVVESNRVDAAEHARITKRNSQLEESNKKLGGRNKFVSALGMFLLLLLFLAVGMALYYKSLEEGKGDPAFRGSREESASKAIDAAKLQLSPSIIDAEEGIVGVRSKGLDGGFYREDVNSLHNGRADYNGPNGFKIHYDDDAGVWQLSGEGKALCKNYFSGNVPPTNGWDCKDKETKSREFDLVDSIYLVDSAQPAGESMVFGEFTESGTRGGRAYFQNEQGCQISYNFNSKGWELLCYADTCMEWKVLYFAPVQTERPPLVGWGNNNGETFGVMPAPSFNLMNLKGNYNKATGEKQKEEQAAVSAEGAPGAPAGATALFLFKEDNQPQQVV